MVERKLNFSAGPSQMPLEVLKEMQDEFLCYKDSGCSVLEMSHRTKDFENIIYGARDTLRRIMEIPEDYEILFIQGGATTQFSMVPMNLAKTGDTFSYVVTGQFAGKARDEGKRWGNAVEIASSKDKNFSYIPDRIEIAPGSKFVHITGNNTIYGTSYNTLFDHGDTPLVADWSSAILGKWIDVKDYDLIYAGAQKNMGPSGLAVVIIKKSLLENEVDPVVPVMLRYKVAAEHDSMYNTPPTYSIYAAGKMFSWVEKMGGVRVLEEINRKKAGILYEYIDNSKLFTNPVREKDRSIMNVTFTLPDENLTKEFLDECKNRGIINIKGHRSVGGMRASIYNGMPFEGVKYLVDTMNEFEKKHR